MKQAKGIYRALAALAALALSLAAAAPLSAQQLVPPGSYRAVDYANTVLQNQSPNSFVWNQNGNGCFGTPGNSATTPFFLFSGSIGGTTVYFPQLITDFSQPTHNELATPTATSQTSSQCSFTAATTYSHTTFQVSSGTGGLQEAVASLSASPVPATVILDPVWYQRVLYLPGLGTPESIIKALKGATNVQIVDVTTSPYVYWRWNGSAYAATALSGGSSAPTVAAGAAAGTSPTISNASGDGNTMVVSLTSGSATTTGTLFTETWATSNAFLYPPTCLVNSTGATAFTAFTYAVTYPSSTHALLTVTATSAPTASTSGYGFRVICQ